MAFLCTNLWMTCAEMPPDLSAHAEMLGIPAAGLAHKRAFNCKNTIHTLYTGRKLGLSTGHAAIAHKWAERLP